MIPIFGVGDDASDADVDRLDIPTLLLARQGEAVTRKTPDLPDTARLEQIQYHIYVRGKIERGQRDVEAGRVVNQDEAKRRMAKWLGGSVNAQAW